MCKLVINMDGNFFDQLIFFLDVECSDILEVPGGDNLPKWLTFYMADILYHLGGAPCYLLSTPPPIWFSAYVFEDCDTLSMPQYQISLILHHRVVTYLLIINKLKHCDITYVDFKTS